VLTDEPATPAGSLRQARLAKARRFEWLGQTTASLCWIVSVVVYGISSSGDWLQLAAASAWLASNLSTLLSQRD